MTAPTPPPAQISEFEAASQIAQILRQVDVAKRGNAVRYAWDSLADGTSPNVQPPLLAGMTHQHPSVPPSGKLDIRTFTATKKPTSDRQFAAVAAYYYRFLAPEAERKDSIGPEDLQKAARDADYRRPHRMTLNNAKSAGLLDPAGERGKYKINTVGENLVAVSLPIPGDGNGKPSHRKPRLRKPVRSTKKHTKGRR